MTKEETTKILVILEMAYPNHYKNLTQEEKSAVITLWAVQFRSVPQKLITKAVYSLISTNKFPPTISDVWDKIKEYKREAINLLESHDNALDTINSLKKMFNEGIPEDVVEQIEQEARARVLNEKTLNALKKIASIGNERTSELSLLATIENKGD